MADGWAAIIIIIASFSLPPFSLSLFLPQFTDDESQFENNLTSRGAAIFLVRMRALLFRVRFRFLTALGPNANTPLPKITLITCQVHEGKETILDFMI